MLPNSYNTSATRSGSFDIGLRDHMQRIYNRMTVGVLITGIVAYFVGNNEQLLNAIFSTPLKWVVMLAPLAIVMFGFNPVRMSSNALRVSFGTLSFLYGLSFAAIFAIFTDESIAKAFFVAAGMFAGVSLYGYTTKKDLSGLGSFAIMGIWGVFILSIVNMFVHNSALMNVISIAGILAFAGMTAFQTQQMKEMYRGGDDPEMASRMSWLAALNLYISFIAMFQYVLQFMGQRQ